MHVGLIGRIILNVEEKWNALFFSLPNPPRRVKKNCAFEKNFANSHVRLILPPASAERACLPLGRAKQNQVKPYS
ncbi:MAG: hypothetical protein Q8K02_11360 [Flavobacterium sp.]|nr:hypothetical protein [Flavobacterium sp.]